MKFFKKHYFSIAFIILVMCTSVLYHYHHIVFLKPQSIHRWRQSDCASLAWNYYTNGMHFFTPEVNNLTSDNGTTGKCAPSEIPVLYFVTAGLYKIFGFHDFIFRMLNTLIFLLGLFYLFKLLFLLLDDFFWAASVSLFFFTSPVLAYYGSSFLSDTPALACSLAGWYFMAKYFVSKEQKWIYISILIFFLAGAFKVTALMSLLVVCTFLIIDLRSRFSATYIKYFTKPVRMLCFIIPALTIIAGWIFYASYYNTCHTCNYFSTTVFPIWSLSKADILEVLHKIRVNWLNQYYHLSVLFFLLIAFIFTTLHFRKAKRYLIAGMLILFFESVAYFILQFWTFGDHDYYTINLFILPTLIFITFFELIKRAYPRIFRSLTAKILFAAFLVFNLLYAKNKLNERYQPPINNYQADIDLYEVEPYLAGFGVKPGDKIISIPDASHCSLYLLNHCGWTEYIDAGFNRTKRVYYNNDSSAIAASAQNGAKYLIVNGIDELYKKPYLASFTTNLAGRYKSIFVFRLGTQVQNFRLPEPKAKQIIFCNCEIIAPDKQSFLDSSNSINLANAGSRSAEEALSGTYSCKLDKKSPFGISYKMQAVSYGERIVITVWQKTGSNYGGIVASGESSADYYNTDFKIIDSTSNGWKKLYNQISVPKSLHNKNLSIYLYNPAESPSYFDDMRIVSYSFSDITVK